MNLRIINFRQNLLSIRNNMTNITKRSLILISSFIFYFSLTAQNATLSGIVKDAYSNEVIPFTNIIIYKTNIGVTSDEEGRYKFVNLQPGFVQLQLSSIEIGRAHV